MRLYLTQRRYYAIAVQPDLFGSPVIVRYWGSRLSRFGQVLTEPYSPDRLTQLDKERKAHGYVLS